MYKQKKIAKRQQAHVRILLYLEVLIEPRLFNIYHSATTRDD